MLFKGNDPEGRRNRLEGPGTWMGGFKKCVVELGADLEREYLDQAVNLWIS
jgi:hypothetical protein